jgi:hypothetical protein
MRVAAIRGQYAAVRRAPVSTVSDEYFRACTPLVLTRTGFIRLRRLKTRNRVQKVVNQGWVMCP